MLKIPEVPQLDKSSLQHLLTQRFQQGACRLSDIPKPSLLKDASKAAKRIATAIKQGESIALVGDYDVDGVTATALVTLFFEDISYPLNVTIPNRFNDGYGVSETLLERIDADVIFTVDNGINAIKAATICKQRGIDLIITDHHTPGEILPDAFAIVNPKQAECHYPAPDICGAQVAWLLMAELKKELQHTIDMKQFLELLTLAIIADVMPLQGINRAMVQAGLQQMMQSQRPASIIIREFLNKSSLTSEDINFQIAPRINSAGRLEDASIALEFLTAKDESTAYHYFDLLDQLNTLRKTTEAHVTDQALNMANHTDLITVVAAEGWNEGVVGIVASRLVHHFKRPAIVLSIKDGLAKGSARSIGDVSIYDLLHKNDTFLKAYGGHKMAAGLQLPYQKLEAFRTGINASASQLHPDSFIPKEPILGSLSGDNIDFELLNLLEQFEPYGEGNPRPRFLAKNAEVLGIKTFGSDRSHSRVTLRLSSHEYQSHEFVAFRKIIPMPKDRKLTCSYTINRNEFQGRITIQLMLEHIY